MKQVTCPHCGDTYPDFDVAHVCSRGPYAPKLKPKMNERIKELLKQSDLQPYYDAQQGQMEKFAELVIRECIQECNKNFAGSVGSHASAHNSAVLKCVNSIKKHFGVKE